MLTIDSAGLEMLDEVECRRLLAGAEIGRVAVTIGALPAIFPVNFRFVDEKVMFLTSEGSKLAAALSESVVAFEADRIEPLTHAGWSIHLLGIARVSTDPTDREAASLAGLHSWVPTHRGYLVTIDPKQISGRHLAPDGYWHSPDEVR
jgi:hypothetical protein